MQNREQFERMLDEIMAEYPDAEKEISALKDKMGAEADLMADEEPMADEMMEADEDLEAMPFPKKKPAKPVAEEDEEDEEEFI